MKKIIVIIALVFIGFSAQAQEKKNKNAKYAVAVNGNCEMCKKRIEKAAYGTSGVKSAVWNVDTHVLDLIVNEQKTSVLNVQKSVAKAGHDSKGVKATQAQYDSLHGCCKYDRE
jgi:cation transport ATPase